MISNSKADLEMFCEVLCRIKNHQNSPKTLIWGFRMIHISKNMKQVTHAPDLEMFLRGITQLEVPWGERSLDLGGNRSLVPLVIDPPWLRWDCIVGTCNTDNGIIFSLSLFLALTGLISWLARKYVFFHFGVNQIKSGISSCIAPKAGLALLPAEGKSCYWRILSRAFGF